MAENWNSDNMCDEGVQEVVDGLTKAFLDFVVGKVQGLTPEDIQNLIDCLTSGAIFPDGQKNFRDSVQDAIIGIDGGQGISESLESAFESVVSSIDGQMEEVKNEARIEFEDSGDYVHIENVPQDQSDEVDSLESRVEDLEEENSNLEDQATDQENKITDLEEQVRECTNKVHVQGHLEPFVWNEGRQLFVCPITRQAYKLIPAEEICPVC